MVGVIGVVLVVLMQSQVFHVKFQFQGLEKKGGGVEVLKSKVNVLFEKC